MLSGIWYDDSTYPSNPNGNALAQEATNAAAHFGNTTAASNRNSYYVVLSPHGTGPDNYQSTSTGYCAWHDYTGDSANLSGGAVATPYGNIAFSNQPYNMDFTYLGQSECGVGFVNGSSGTLDGYTMTMGHEFSEMESDVDPSSAWVNPGTNGGTKYYENGDECAWIQPGQPGGAANVTFGSAGTFAEQSIWSNDDNSCDISHPIVSHGTSSGNTVTVTNPGNQTGTVGTATSLQLAATDSASGQTLTYSASGLPAGLSISASGDITGTPTTAGTSDTTVTATDSTGAAGSTSFTWTISSSSGGGGCPAAQLIVNGGFENGTSPWTGTTGSILEPALYGGTAHTGNYAAWLDGYGYPATDTLALTVTIPSTCKSATYAFWRDISTQEITSTNADDTLKVQVLNPSGTVLATLHTYSNLDADNTYDRSSFSLNQFIGQKITLKFTGTETDANGGTTNFLLDDVALNVN
ncbi:putative Ig domain-containing protein [Actinospica acidithermotolerans]|uniref:putative Ig domain-containing protein n=1 Tax=Actinospica acidithermotolerans TaxID=2828514 RepID=UPI0027DB80E3|nr:putative Ig domain-containing protein [Actinospica acidithermotolerans]